MLLVSTGMMAGFFYKLHSHMCSGLVQHLFHSFMLPTWGLRSSQMTNTEPIPEMPFPGFILVSPTLEVTDLSHIWLETQLFQLDRHTHSYQQLEVILGCFGVLGKLLETKTRKVHLTSVNYIPECLWRTNSVRLRVSTIISTGNLPHL